MAIFEGAATGKQTFLGQGAGRYPTAYNVLQDLCDLQEGKGFHTHWTPSEQVYAQNLTPMQFYLRGSQADLADWPETKIDGHWDDGIRTTSLPVGEVHKWVFDHPNVFAAAVVR